MRREQCPLYDHLKQSFVASHYSTCRGKGNLGTEAMFTPACCVTPGKLHVVFPHGAHTKSHIMIVPCSGDASGRVC